MCTNKDGWQDGPCGRPPRESVQFQVVKRLKGSGFRLDAMTSLQIGNWKLELPLVGRASSRAGRPITHRRDELYESLKFASSQSGGKPPLLKAHESHSQFSISKCPLSVMVVFIIRVIREIRGFNRIYCGFKLGTRVTRPSEAECAAARCRRLARTLAPPCLLNVSLLSVIICVIRVCSF